LTGKAVLTLLWGCGAVAGYAAPADRTFITPPGAEARTAPPFSNAVRVGDTLYVAGHLGLDPATGQAPADVDAEARQVMEAVKRTLEQSGMSTDELVSVTVYCTSLDLYDKFNGVYRTYFHGRYPARAFIGINTLLRGAHFEVAGIAVKSRPAQ
jgi:2-iminobutanoate/2-iminopropanoate deaminase